ncbi:ATP-dependent zinc metalloprotease FtsH [Candidatus Deianiraea vastatrix]|uniref:ATP-dependent zinc metalloprotease FtsH n=1 Tax=Candidatus Deianiraea vastatrix TaxID=2163644 RepID=A0A5B8XH15_9RICK|nr:ATP-dependent zinc metalloprotease FtsH [Candidatus Deianiraea vastatrix]QED23157.1 ATP-dependent zinc metalloprotease FtsH [Candidatus Deianiraea vastatrix]
MKNFFLWIAIFFLGFSILDTVISDKNVATEIQMSEFLKLTEEKKVESVLMADEKVYIFIKEAYKLPKQPNQKENVIKSVVEKTTKEVVDVKKSPKPDYISYINPYYSTRIIDDLKKADSKIEIQKRDDGGLAGRIFNILGMLLSWLPLLLILGFWISMNRQMNGGSKGGSGGGGMMGGNPFSFGKSKAKAIMPKDIKTRFKDVAGIDEAKADLEEMVDFLKAPFKYRKIGAKIPKGCLLVGQPGTGKTLLAKAIAGEAGVPFFFISGSDFVEMFVGVGASRVRDLFGQAKKHNPCIIFIDEIDAVGRHRGIGNGGGNDEREQTLNQMLVEMDGFEENSGIIVLAATNRPDVLDPALLRPGRFDRQIVVSMPDVNGREEILKVHTKNVKLAPDINIRNIARGTPGFSGAELANVVNEAALLAAKRGQSIVQNQDFEDAKDKIMMGSERKSLKMKDEEKKLTAYHEGAHALVGLDMPASDPIHKATIIPRGRALGMVMRLPEDDRFSLTREKMHADLAVAMAGRVAEEMIFGYNKVTSGASSDIKMATNLARAMVTEWGLTESIGNVNHAGESRDIYIGGSKSRYHCSEHSAQIIDDEVKKLVQGGFETAKEILSRRIDDLHALAKALLEYETLTGDEIKDILSGKKIRENLPKEDEISADANLGLKRGFASNL